MRYPFHESILHAIDRAFDWKEMRPLLVLLSETEVPPEQIPSMINSLERHVSVVAEPWKTQPIRDTVVLLEQRKKEADEKKEKAIQKTIRMLDEL